jgi:hypothetical protein
MTKAVSRRNRSLASKGIWSGKKIPPTEKNPGPGINIDSLSNSAKNRRNN